jgi:succinoglycan biosynthesis transport protein ExoP
MNKNQMRRQETTPITIRQIVQALKAHIHILIMTSVLLATAGIAVVSLLPNVYSASTTILVDPQKIPEKYVSSTVTIDTNARMTTLKQQILSASRLQEIIDKDNLYPELRKKKSREEVLDFMRNNTKIELKESPEPEQGLSSFSITYEDSDRLRVALITNELAANFVSWNLRGRQQQALGTTQFLSGELQRAKEGLEQQESQLAAFKMSHSGATPDELNANLQALSRLQSEAQADTDAISRLDQERILLTQSKPVITSQIEPVTERGRLLQEKRRLENDLRTLKRQFTDTYPDVITLNGQLKDLYVRLEATPEEPNDAVGAYDSNTQLRLSLIDKELQQRKLQLANLQRQTGSYQFKVDSVPVLETQLAELSRNYEASRENYQSLLDKTFSAGMSEELEKKQQAARYTVLDLAKAPEKPVRPKRLLFMAGVLFGAFLFPAGTVIFIDRSRGAIKSDIEVREMLPFAIPILATIPPINSEADQRREKLRTIQTVVVSVAACTAVVLFLLKVRPIL